MIFFPALQILLGKSTFLNSPSSSDLRVKSGAKAVHARRVGLRGLALCTGRSTVHAWREPKYAATQKGDRNCNRHFKDQVYLCTKHKYVNRSILASANAVNEIVCVCLCMSVCVHATSQ